MFSSRNFIECIRFAILIPIRCDIQNTNTYTRIYLCFVVSIESNNIIRYVIQSIGSWAKIFLVRLSIHSVKHRMQNDIHIILLPYEKLSGVSIRFAFLTAMTCFWMNGFAIKRRKTELIANTTLFRTLVKSIKITLRVPVIIQTECPKCILFLLNVQLSIYLHEICSISGQNNNKAEYDWN